MMKAVQSIFKMVPLALVVGTIFFLSHQPSSELYSFDVPGIDKVAHLTIFGILAATVLYAIPGKIKGGYRVPVVCFTVAMCFFYGVIDEYHQSFIPGRYPSGYDLLADVIGAILVASLWLIMVSRVRK
jgi:VanZ family protein